MTIEDVIVMVAPVVAALLAFWLGSIFGNRPKDTPFSLACKLNTHLSKVITEERATNARLVNLIATMRMAAQSQDFEAPVRGMADLIRKQYPIVEPNIPENDEVQNATDPFTFDAGGLA